MKKKFVIFWVLVLIVMALFIVNSFSTQRQGLSFLKTAPIEEKRDWNLYENKEFGISFRYPSEFKVYQTDENRIKIVSNYKNQKHQGIAANIGIERKNTYRETPDSFITGIKPDISALPEGFPEDLRKEMEERRYSIEHKDNYDLIIAQNGEVHYFILSDSGTLFIKDTLGLWKTELEEDGVYDNYRTKFDQIIHSIKIFY